MSAPTPAPGDERPREGYYPDPSIPGYVRYWNGAAWVPGTSRPAPSDGEPLPPPPGVSPAPAPAPAPASASASAEETGPVFFDENPQAGQSEPGPAETGAIGTGVSAWGRSESQESPGADQHGARPEPASAWQADAGRQTGLGGEPDRRVSWGGGPGQSDPRVPSEGAPRAEGTGDDGRSAQAQPQVQPDASHDDSNPGTVTIRAVKPGAAKPTAGEGTVTFRRPTGPVPPAPSPGTDGTMAIRAIRPKSGRRNDATTGAPQPSVPQQGTASPQSATPQQASQAQSVQPAQSPVPQQGTANPQAATPQQAPHAPQAQSVQPAQPPVPQQGTASPQAATPQQAPHAPQAQSAQPNQSSVPQQGTASPQSATPQQAHQSPQAQPAQASVPQQAAVPTPVTSGDGGGSPSWAQQVHQLAQAPAVQQDEGQPVVPWKPVAADPFLAVAQAQAAARPAGLGRRFAARLVDTAVLAVVTGAAALPLGTKAADHIDSKIDAAKLSGEKTTVWLLDGTTAGYLGMILAVLLLFGVVYEALPTAKWGRTLGKKVCGIEVRDIEEHEAPTFGAALKRWLVYSVPGVLVIGVVGVLWCLFDRPWRQCWHDKAANTFVAG
ncbi:RDD family protein [Streptomyces sp. NPDC029674]|uniref:RDD family protein n=1 Tax=Streptomyces sp. NPDC029674 TaxID=3365297 RepID=UPI00384F6AF3